MSHQNRFGEAESRLRDAIVSSDLRGIRDSIQNLISNKCSVSIKFESYLPQCSVHDAYNQSTPNRFSDETLIFSYACTYSHNTCRDCCKLFVEPRFPLYNFNNHYECPGCYRYGIQNSLIFDTNILEQWLRLLLGSAYIDQAIIALTQETTPGPLLNIYRQCNVNNCGKTDCKDICSSGHQVCKECLVTWAAALAQNTDGIRCPISGCNDAIVTSTLLAFLGDTSHLSPLKDRLLAFGLILDFCYNCKTLVKLDTNVSESLTCVCSAKICTSCGAEDHFGFTCFYTVVADEFKEIELVPPKDPDHPVTILDKEWHRARYAFNSFIHPAEGVEFKQAKLYVNKPLEQRYAQKKQEMANQCGGRDKVNELFIWHGSKQANYPIIMQEGLKVGAVDGIGIAKGKVHGYGVYSATTPDTPKQYAEDSRWVACFLALKGNESPNSIEDPALLNNGKTHSYVPKNQKDWLVLFTKEQVLPRYLVEYKHKGK